MTATEKMKELILENFNSIREFADASQMPYTTVHTILKRGIENSSVDNVIRMCQTLNINVDDILSDNQGDIHTIAAHAIKDLTDEEIEEVINFAKFIKTRNRNNRD